MTRQRLLLAAAPLACLAATSSIVSAFTTTSSSIAFTRSFAAPVVLPQHTLSTRLYSEAEDEQQQTEGEVEEKAAEDHQLPAEEATDILNSPAFLKRKIDVLKSDVEAIEGDITEAMAALDRGKEEWGQKLDALQSEYQNIQDRMNKQSKEGGGTATIEVVRKMLEVMDNYDRAFGALSADTEEEKEMEATYKATYDLILKIFDDLGVKPVETLGTEFDYEVHQAVMQRPCDEYEEGLVCDELARGWVLDDKLIRAAMVSVSAG